MTNPVTQAITIVGLKPLADGCGRTYQAVRKWELYGLPRTEWTGESDYARTIEQLTAAKGRKVSRDDLLSWSQMQRKAS